MVLCVCFFVNRKDHVPDPRHADAETHHLTSISHRTGALLHGLVLVPDLVVVVDLAVILGPTTKLQHYDLWAMQQKWTPDIHTYHTRIYWEKKKNIRIQTHIMPIKPLSIHMQSKHTRNILRLTTIWTVFRYVLCTRWSESIDEQLKLFTHSDLQLHILFFFFQLTRPFKTKSTINNTYILIMKFSCCNF